MVIELQLCVAFETRYEIILHHTYMMYNMLLKYPQGEVDGLSVLLCFTSVHFHSFRFLSFSVSLYNFILTVSLFEYLGKHSCMRSLRILY